MAFRHENVDWKKDYSSLGSIHISKALLKGVGDYFGLSDFDLYQRYVRAFELTHSEYNIDSLKRLPIHEERIRKITYCFSRPDLEPSNFSFFSHSDVNRLARIVSNEGVLNCSLNKKNPRKQKHKKKVRIKKEPCEEVVDLVSSSSSSSSSSSWSDSEHETLQSARLNGQKYEIVIYFCPSRERLDEIEYLHDFRCVNPNSPYPNNIKPLFFLVTANHQLYRISPLSNNFLFTSFDMQCVWLTKPEHPQGYPTLRHSALPYFCRDAQEKFFRGHVFSSRRQESLSVSLSRLLRLKIPDRTSSLSQVSSVLQLQELEEELTTFWGLNNDLSAAGPSTSTSYKLVILTTFGRLNVTSTNNRRLTPRLTKLSRTANQSKSAKNTYFTTLACFGSKSAGHLAALTSRTRLTQYGMTKISDLALSEQEAVRSCLNQIAVVCLFGGGRYMVQLRDDFLLSVICQVTQPTYSDKIAPMQFDIPHYHDRKRLLGDKLTRTQKGGGGSEEDSDNRWCSDSADDVNSDPENEDDIFWNVSDDDHDGGGGGDDDAGDVGVHSKGKKKFFKPQKKNCGCELCSSQEYQHNMSHCGPEKLLQHEWSLRDLLRMLGQDSKENIKLVDHLLDMSMASMDIESMTVKLSQQCAGDSKFKYKTIESKVSVEDHPVFIQKPIMICHADWLSLIKPDPDKDGTEEEKEESFDVDRNHLLLLQAPSDDESDLFEFIRTYWRHVVHRYRIIVDLKKKMAQPLLDIVAKYHRAHLAAHATWTAPNLVDIDENGTVEFSSHHPYIASVEERKNVDNAWKHSLVGKLERKLNALIEEYSIFSFYG